MVRFANQDELHNKKFSKKIASSTKPIPNTAKIIPSTLPPRPVNFILVVKLIPFPNKPWYAREKQIKAPK